MQGAWTPYALTYGHDVVLPMEVVVQSLKIAVQNQLTCDKFAQSMLIELGDLDESRLDALDHLRAQK